MQSIVVVGASLAGLRAVEELRRAGFDGRITVVGEEPHLPYDRAPLSKQVLAGEWAPERTGLLPGGTGSNGVDGGRPANLEAGWRLGTRAAGLDSRSRRVTLESGEAVPYDGLVIATGARPRPPSQALTSWRGRRGPASRRPDEQLTGIYTLRTLDDCLAIRAALDASPRRVVVVGAGFVGAEVAATCRERGLAVSLIEASSTLLEAATGRQVGTVLGDIHRDHGVDLRLGVGARQFVGSERVEQVRLADGARLDADLVVVDTGTVPNTGWLAGSRLAVSDGVVCDASLMAGPGVAAAGDVARWPSARYGSSLRVEHCENAATMGRHAARSLLDHGIADGSAAGPGTGWGRGAGDRPAYDPVPWFWSDQYDRKLQIAGLVTGAEEALVMDGSLEERRFAAIYRRGDRVVGVVAMNQPRQMVAYRGLVERNAPWKEAAARS